MATFEGYHNGCVALMLHGLLFFGGGCLCLYPNKRWLVGYHPSGKPKYYITDRFTDFVGETSSGSLVPVKYDQLHLVRDNFVERYRDGLITPCGQCLECRIAKSKEWANRLMIERDYHDTAYFLTLTYDETHVHRVPAIGDDGNPCEVMTLHKEDLPSFLKRLRAALDYRGLGQIRFYGVGEYGSQTLRPHYHLIVYGLELPDLYVWARNFRGEKYYRSPLVEDCWRDKSKRPIGNIMIADCTWETCAYVARYVVKKWTGVLGKSWYEDRGIEPEFALMSRKPGIARQYYDEHKDYIYEHDEINLSTSQGGRLVKPPAYYDRLYDLDDPTAMEIIKATRQADAEVRAATQALVSGLTDEERLQARRNLYQSRNRALMRDTI